MDRVFRVSSDRMCIVTEYDKFTVMEEYGRDCYGIREYDDPITEVERNMGEVQCQEWVRPDNPKNTIFLFDESISDTEKEQIKKDWNQENLGEYDLIDQYFSAKFPVGLEDSER